MFVDIQAIEGKDGFFLVVPHGPIDNETYQELKQKIAPLLCETTQGILIDLKDIEYISSVGLGVLFSIKKFMSGMGGDLVFCNLKPQIQKLFEIVRTLSKETMFRDYMRLKIKTMRC